MANIERDPWPRELWWCENPACNEPTTEDPCEFCGEAVVRYKVVLEADHRGAVEAGAKVIEAWDAWLKDGVPEWGSHDLADAIRALRSAVGGR